jgi:hypothetical protein
MSKPRLRIIRDEKDIRISKSDYESGLAKFMAELRERFEYVSVGRDGHRASVFISPTIQTIPRYAYIIRRNDGAIVDMSACKRGKVVGSVLNCVKTKSPWE